MDDGDGFHQISILMDDGDGHHIFCIDGDEDGHHFKGDGRHV